MVAVNILNKKSRKADKGWSSSLGDGWGAKNLTVKKSFLRNVMQGSGLEGFFGTTQAMENRDVEYGMLEVSIGQVQWKS